MQLLLDKSLLFCSHNFQMLHMNHVVALGSLSSKWFNFLWTWMAGRNQLMQPPLLEQKTGLLVASVATKRQNVHVTLTMRRTAALPSALPIKMPHFACAENRANVLSNGTKFEGDSPFCRQPTILQSSNNRFFFNSGRLRVCCKHDAPFPSFMLGRLAPKSKEKPRFCEKRSTNKSQLCKKGCESGHADSLVF